MKRKSVSYAKWGYIFIAPFFIVYTIFQLYPLLTTVYDSFFRHFKSMGSGQIIGPEFVGIQNYIDVFTGARGTDFMELLGNTLIMWIMGFIPQIVVSLLFAYWFTNKRLDLKCTGVFKTIIYMPNLIMASAFSMLIFAIFSSSKGAPVNSILIGLGLIQDPIDFSVNQWTARGLVALINFIMWFGNTTILLMAGMMGVDESLVEAADIDGCTPNQIFWKITVPLIRPIMVYVMITSLVGGLQMFDVPKILIGNGPKNSTKTVIMYLSDKINQDSFDYGSSGAISVIMFIICAALSMIVYYFFTDRTLGGAKSFSTKKKKKKEA